MAGTAAVVAGMAGMEGMEGMERMEGGEGMAAELGLYGGLDDDDFLFSHKTSGFLHEYSLGGAGDIL
jgi:hypothetical protein